MKRVMFLLSFLTLILAANLGVAAKLSDRTELTAPVTSDILWIVDVSDTSEAATGTTKKVTVNTLGITATGVDFNDGTTFAGTIESIAKNKLHTLTHTPTGDSNTIFTPFMCKVKVDLTSGAMRTAGALNTSHAIACYSYLELTGAGDWSQQFINESKLKSTNSGTGHTLSFYKGAVDAVSGTIINVLGLDLNLDLDALDLIYTNAYAVYAPQDEWDILIGGKFNVGQDIDFDATVTGTVGNVTINKSAGRVIMAASASSVVVTNSLVTENSIVLVSGSGALDATAFLFNVTATNGSFTINASAAATSNKAINFLVVN